MHEYPFPPLVGHTGKSAARAARRGIGRVLAHALLVAHAATAIMAVAEGAELYLVDANIVDPVRQEIRPGNLLIRDGVIVGTPERAPEPFTGTTLDLNGKWVIPGLIDLHTHTYGNLDGNGGTADMVWTPVVAQRLLYAGVTGFLDLFGNEDMLFEVRAQQRAGDLGGADMFASLSCITIPGGHGTEYGVPARTVTSPEEARRAVESLALRQPDVIKIIYGPGPENPGPSIDKPTLFAAVAAANANGLKTVVHVNVWQNVRDALDAGASAVTHVPGTAIPPDLARLMAEKGMASIPTLAVQTETYDFVYDPSVLDHPLARALAPPAVIDSYRGAEYRTRLDAFKARFEEVTPVMLGSVKTMADAGVMILAGTDSGSVGTIQGYSTHRELIKLVAAGLSPWQALAAATTDAGAFLGLAHGVQPGDDASLVVLDASPIEDIGNTQRIAYVIHHGTVVDRESLLGSELAGLR